MANSVLEAKENSEKIKTHVKLPEEDAGIKCHACVRLSGKISLKTCTSFQACCVCLMPTSHFSTLPATAETPVLICLIALFVLYTKDNSVSYLNHESVLKLFC